MTKKALEENANVIATCRNRTEARELLKLQENYPEPRLLIFELDVTSKDQLEEMRRTIRKNGIDVVDICIANAGISSKNHPYDPALSCPMDDMLNTFQTNAMATLYTG
jgi:short-subunit dehydrogenase